MGYLPLSPNALNNKTRRRTLTELNNTKNDKLDKRASDNMRAA